MPSKLYWIKYCLSCTCVLNGCHQESSWSWSEFKYYGHNHGEWILYGSGENMFCSSIVYATVDIQPYNRKHGYDIKLIGSAMGNTTNDTLINDGISSSLTLNTDGHKSKYLR